MVERGLYKVNIKLVTQYCFRCVHSNLINCILHIYVASNVGSDCGLSEGVPKLLIMLGSWGIEQRSYGRSQNEGSLTEGRRIKGRRRRSQNEGSRSPMVNDVNMR